MQEIQPKELITNRLTGEIVESIPPNSKKGEYRIQRDWTGVPSQADQSQKDMNNVSVLVQKFKPDELAQYIAQKNNSRRPIEGHDFSQEPNLQDALNSVYAINEMFKELPEEIQYKFRGKPSEFIKFWDNPKNIPQLKAWGLIKEPSVMPEESGKPAKGVPEETSSEVK